MKLDKTKLQVEEDWDEAASLPNYRNTIAQGYSEEDAFKAIGESQTKEILKFLNQVGVSIDGKEIVEIGCGAGRMTEFLAKKARSIYATDVSDKMLARFRERLGTIRNVLTIKSADLDPIPSESVDVVLSFFVFQHNPEEMVEKFIEDSYRVLKPYGFIAFQLTTMDEHTVTKNQLRATDMVRWTAGEIDQLAKNHNFQQLTSPKSLIKIWRK